MNLFRNKNEKLDRHNPNEMYYETKPLSTIKYVKVVYMGLDDKYHEIKTDVKFIGESLISLYFKYSYDFNINYPQDVKLKMVTADAMYIARAVLQEIKKSDKTVYFSVIPPVKMVRRQERKYSRANINRSCVLNVCDEKGIGEVYLAKTVNISGSGILINNPESMQNEDIIELNLSTEKYYNIILFLDADVILKLPARFVRTTENDGLTGYAFQFLDLEQKIIDIICKYVTNEQIRQLRMQQRVR